jgi:hypothetical protein
MHEMHEIHDSADEAQSKDSLGTISIDHLSLKIHLTSLTTGTHRCRGSNYWYIAGTIRRAATQANQTEETTFPRFKWRWIKEKAGGRFQ